MYFCPSSSIVIRNQDAGYTEAMWLLRYEVTISSDIKVQSFRYSHLFSSFLANVLTAFLLSLSQSAPGWTPVTAGMDTIDHGSAHCEKGKPTAYDMKSGMNGLHAGDRRTALPLLIGLPVSQLSQGKRFEKGHPCVCFSCQQVPVGRLARNIGKEKFW